MTRVAGQEPSDDKVSFLSIILEFQLFRKCKNVHFFGLNEHLYSVLKTVIKLVTSPGFEEVRGFKNNFHNHLGVIFSHITVTGSYVYVTEW